MPFRLSRWSRSSRGFRRGKDDRGKRAARAVLAMLRALTKRMVPVLPNRKQRSSHVELLEARSACGASILHHPQGNVGRDMIKTVGYAAQGATSPR